MLKRTTSLFLALILFITCLPFSAFAQEGKAGKEAGEVIKGELVEGEDGGAYYAFPIKRSPRVEKKSLLNRMIARHSVFMALGGAPEEDTIPGYSLKVAFSGRSEFKHRDAGYTFRLAHVDDHSKIFGVATITPEQITNNPDTAIAVKFTKSANYESIKADLTQNDARLLVPYDVDYTPELTVSNPNAPSYVVVLNQKVNPLWKAEWHVKDGQTKPEISAYYKNQSTKKASDFYLPTDDTIYSMEADSPKELYWDGSGPVNVFDHPREPGKNNGHFKRVVVGNDAKINKFTKDYSGKLGVNDLKLTGDLSNPNAFIGFGDSDSNEQKTFIKDANNVKYLLNVYPTMTQATNPTAKVKVPSETGKYLEGKEIPAYRAIKRYAVYSTVSVKFNTGDGFLTAQDKTDKKSKQDINVTLSDAQIKAQTIEDTDYADKAAKTVTAQTMGYSEKLKDNESGREVAFPDGTKLLPPAQEEGQKTENKFIGWNTDANAKTAMTEDQLAAVVLNQDVTTFYAIYAPKAPGKAMVKYDLDGTEKDASQIEAKYKIVGKDYPTELTGNKDEKIADAVFVKKDAPKFIGYEIDTITTQPVPPVGKTANYTENGEFRVIYKYKKLDPIIPEKNDNGTPNDKVTDDVKATYIPVTIKVDTSKGQFKKDDAVKTEAEFKYYVNPVEDKSLQAVLTASGLTAEAKNTNVNQIDTAKPWTFTPAQTEVDAPVAVALSTKIDKDNFKNTKAVTMEVNFKQSEADKLRDKLKPVDIKVWQNDADTDGSKIDWKKGIAKLDDSTLQAILDKAETKVSDLGEGGTLDAPKTSRNSSKQNLPDGKVGNLKVAFEDGSSLVVENQKLYVAPHKNVVKDGEPNQINPDNLPKGNLAVKFLLGEGVKIGTKEGNATNPVPYETYYVKPNTSLEASDIPATTLQDNYKDNAWYNGTAKLAEADYTNITEAKEFTAKAVLKGQGSAELAFVDDKGNAIDILNTKKDLKLPNQDYVQTAKGKDGAKITYDKSKAPKILGYEFTNEEPVISPANFKEGAKAATITLKYKKIDDIIGPNKPADQKPEGYVTVAFKATTGATLDPSEMSYFVNPAADVKAKVSKVGDNYQISGKKADGTDLTGNVPAINISDASKYELKYVDADKKWAYDNFDKVGQDLTTDTTFTAQVTKLGEPNVTFPPVEIEKGGSKVVTPEVKDKYNKKIENPGKPEVNEKPNGVTVTPNDDGTVKIEVPKDYTGSGTFTIKVTYKVDGKDVPGEIKVTIKEDKKPEEPKPSAPAITWKGYWYLGDSKTEPVQPKMDMETGRHYKYLYGYVDKTVRPEGMITRSEAAALIARLANLDMTDKTKPNFKDTPSAWYNGAINAMVAKNLMFADKDGNFRPNEPITRGEFARALYYIDKKNDKVAPFADVKGHEFEDAINQAYGNGRIAGYQDGTFKPNANIQRAEAARILNQFADRNVTLAGMSNVKNDLVRFTDINESHWAYCEVMEAANSHEYRRVKGTLPETWLKILDK